MLPSLNAPVGAKIMALMDANRERCDHNIRQAGICIRARSAQVIERDGACTAYQQDLKMGVLTPPATIKMERQCDSVVFFCKRVGVDL
jgi:hypothetical protein